MCLLTLRYLLLVYLNYLKYEIARHSLKGAQSYFIYGILISYMVWQSGGSRIVGLMVTFLCLILIELIVDLPFPLIAVVLFFTFLS